MISKKQEMEQSKKKNRPLTRFEEEADKFVPGEFGAGTLLQAKRDIDNVLNLKTLRPATFNEGDTSMVLYELIHSETKECALIMLKEETHVMHLTNEFDSDYEVVVKGTSKMRWQESEEEE